jgi:dGTPase
VLNWEKLLNGIRRKDLHASGNSMGTAASRTEIERDHDRILFSTPTRRLADKTQVFPMEVNDSVRTRLTHSHEVSNLARSIGVRIAFDHAEEVFGPRHEELQVKRNVPSLLAAIGLGHDLGNPPFGHQGEKAIREWFKGDQGRSTDADFVEFDGNAQTLRLLTRLQLLNDQFGLNLTVGTLAALIKYPVIYGSNNKFGFKKFGIFRSEADIAREVWHQTGLEEGVRHPLTYVMEACDDIAYSIIDAEDTVKKGYASFYDLMDFLECYDANDPVIRDVVAASRKKNAEYKIVPSLSSRELNDISMQMFRVKAIADMVNCVTAAFVANVDRMLNNSISAGFELINQSPCSQLCKAAKQFDFRYGYQHRDVLKIELQGNSLIKSMMTMLWTGISLAPDPSGPFARFVYGEISENYRRVFADSKHDDYAKCQLLCDTISGMTESHLLAKHNELKRLLVETR